MFITLKTTSLAKSRMDRGLNSYFKSVPFQRVGSRVVRWHLGKLPVPGRPTVWMIVGQGHTALAVGAVGGCLDIFTLISPFSPSLWETA